MDGGPDTLAPPQRDEEIVTHLDEDWAIVCDIAALSRLYSGFPPCPDRPAEWVAWRPNVCQCYPRHRLVCDPCRIAYIQRAAQDWYFSCPTCGIETGGYLTYTPIRGKRT